jgi:hypothetical protein
LVLLKKKYLGFFHFLGILPKKSFLGFFSAKIGPFETSSIYSESAHKTLPENAHFLTCGKWKIRLGEKVRWSGNHHKTFISNFFIF